MPGLMQTREPERAHAGYRSKRFSWSVVNLGTKLKAARVPRPCPGKHGAPSSSMAKCSLERVHRDLDEPLAHVLVRERVYRDLDEPLAAK